MDSKVRFISSGLVSSDGCSLQYHLFVEKMVREHCGEVNRTTFNIKSKDKNVSLDPSILMNKLNGTVIEGGENYRFIFGEGFAIKAFVNLSVGGIVEDEIDDLDSPEIANPSFGFNCPEGSILETIYLEIYYIDKKLFDNIVKICESEGYKVVTKFDCSEGVPIVFTWPRGSGFDYRQQSFDKIKLDSVKNNYLPEVIDKVKKFLEYSENVSHGLVVLNGPVGTGKSYLIRSILSELPSRRGVICSPSVGFLESAGLLLQVVAQFKKSIVVLEDIGEVIAADAASRYIDARSNLLNIAEGLLSLMTDSIFIISFNYELSKVDPAILRPGRCLANIEVNELPYEQARTLVNFDIPEKNYSLADIYEMRRIGNASQIKVERRIGFGR